MNEEQPAVISQSTFLFIIENLEKQLSELQKKILQYEEFISIKNDRIEIKKGRLVIQPLDGEN